MKRYEKIVLRQKEGITFEVSKNSDEELIIRARNIATTNVSPQNNLASPISEEDKRIREEKNTFLSIITANVSSKNYANPPVPTGYRYVCGKWYNGFVITRCSDGSEFVWVPVGFLAQNGLSAQTTLPSSSITDLSYTERFGRRNYTAINFHMEYRSFYYESLTNELKSQHESVKKYGGFYISRYHISKSPVGSPQSIKGVIPWTNISFDEAKEVAATIENNKTIKSHLIFGSEYDSVLEWFIESNARTRSEIIDSSSEWGNYSITDSTPNKRIVLETGTKEDWCTNNIYDFAGNVSEWTQEICFREIDYPQDRFKVKLDEDGRHTVRGGGYFFYDYLFNSIPMSDFLFSDIVSSRVGQTNFSTSDSLGFRAALWIK